MRAVGAAPLRPAGSRVRERCVFVAALAAAWLSVAMLLVARGAGASLRLAQAWLNADVVVVPAGGGEAVAHGLLLGAPAPLNLPYDSAQRIAGLPGVAAASAQLYLSCPPRSASCTVPGMFLIAYDPATDFALRPFLTRSLPAGLAPGSALGGSAVAVPRGEEGILVFGTMLHLAANLPPTGTSLDRSLLFPLETAHELARASSTHASTPLPVPLSGVSAVLVRVRAGSDPRVVAAEVQRRLPEAAAIAAPELFAGLWLRASRLAQAAWAMLGAAGVLVVGLAALPGARRPLRVLLCALAGAGLGAALACPALGLCAGLIRSALGLPFLPPAAALSVAMGAGGVALAAAAARLARWPAPRANHSALVGRR